MFDQMFDVIMLTPLNFAEIVAKTRRHEDPITVEDCVREHAKCQSQNKQGYVYILRLGRKD